jgi:Concanavalin A-like lectin/glucanases superfamily
MLRSRVTRLAPLVAAIAAVVVPKARALCQAQGTKGAAKLVGSANLADGAWHTITCEKKPSALNMYVDGALTATKPNTIGSIANAAALTIGAKDIGGDWFRGDMDDATVSIG